MIRIVFIEKETAGLVGPPLLHRHGGVGNREKTRAQYTGLSCGAPVTVSVQRNSQPPNATAPRSNREPSSDDGDDKPNDRGSSTNARHYYNTMAHVCNIRDRRSRSRFQPPAQASEQALPRKGARPREQQVCI